MKLQFTNGYRPRFDQISRIIQFLLTQKGKTRVKRVDIIAATGIPDKQIENLTSMMTGFGLVLPRVSLLTLFGEAIAQYDLYFEKVETLWIMHYLVSSNPEWVVWYRIINQVLPTQDHYEVDEISIRYFADLSIHYSAQAVREKLPKEVGAVLAAYSRSEFSKLNLINNEATGDFSKSSPVTIPDLAFLYCIMHFRDKFSPGATALNTETICTAENSPGKVLDLPEYQVRTILENLHNSEFVRLEMFANLDQVRFSDNLTLETIIQKIYRVANVN